jgi:hypothetical protein
MDMMLDSGSLHCDPHPGEHAPARILQPQCS